MHIYLEGCYKGPAIGHNHMVLHGTSKWNLVSSPCRKDMVQFKDTMWQHSIVHIVLGMWPRDGKAMKPPTNYT